MVYVPSTKEVTRTGIQSDHEKVEYHNKLAGHCRTVHIGT